jgi:hypothetical protein
MSTPIDVKLKSGSIITARAPQKSASTVGGVRISHPDREYWPGITKRHLAEYWQAVASLAAPSPPRARATYRWSSLSLVVRRANVGATEPRRAVTSCIGASKSPSHDPDRRWSPLPRQITQRARQTLRSKPRSFRSTTAILSHLRSCHSRHTPGEWGIGIPLNHRHRQCRRATA